MVQTTWLRTLERCLREKFWHWKQKIDDGAIIVIKSTCTKRNMIVKEGVTQDLIENHRKSSRQLCAYKEPPSSSTLVQTYLQANRIMMRCSWSLVIYVKTHIFWVVCYTIILTTRYQCTTIASEVKQLVIFFYLDLKKTIYLSQADHSL